MMVNFLKKIWDFVKNKETWDFVAKVAFPAAIAFTGYIINHTIAEKDRSLRYIEFAVNILNTQQNPDVRDWAVDVINYYSDVKMSGKIKQAISAKVEALEEGPDQVVGKGRVSVPPYTLK